MMKKPFFLGSSLRRKHTAISLAEIILTIGVFSTAIAGLYLATQGMNEAINTAMKRDIEAAFAFMKMAEVNPYNPLLDPNDDVGTRTAVSLPNGDSVYYTRAAETHLYNIPDVQYVDVYLYRNATTPTPYRHFFKSLNVYMKNYNLGEITNYYRDTQGNVWSPIDNTEVFATGVGGWRRSGYDPTYAYSNIDGTASCATVTGTPDQTIFQKSAEGTSGTLGFIVWATPNRNYTVRVGFVEYNGAIATGNRKMTVSFPYSNYASVTVDPVAETGGTCKALVKTFRLRSYDQGWASSTLNVRFSQGPGATANPRVAFVSIARS